MKERTDDRLTKWLLFSMQPVNYLEGFFSCWFKIVELARKYLRLFVTDAPCISTLLVHFFNNDLGIVFGPFDLRMYRRTGSLLGRPFYKQTVVKNFRKEISKFRMILRTNVA